MTKATWGGKCLFHSQFLITYHFIIKAVRAGTKTRQEHGNRSQCKGLERELLTGLLPMAFSVFFPIELSITMNWLAYSPILWRQFLKRGSVLSDDSSF